MTKILQPGTFLKNNSYRIQRLLGQGGFGAVYLADDLILDKPCAIKESFDNSPGAQAQFEIEARILANLSHPHLPRVTDNFIDPATGLQYLVMEYVEGQDLGELLQRSGPLPEEEVRHWADQVLDALAYLHSFKPRPVVHRDVKPDNIRLLPDGKTVKLVDFGIAKIGGALDRTRKGAHGVTRGFSPPEQYGTGTDTFTDVYAFGATLYNLLTDVLPPDAIDRAHSGAQLIPPRQLNPSISVEIEQIILTSMQLDPALRFPNAGEMRLALHGKRSTIVLAKCPHCRKQVRVGAKFCANCGKVIAQATPFTFQRAGFQARNLQELIRGCDTYWEEAVTYFMRGDLDAWLSNLGEDGDKLAKQGQALRSKHSDPSAALEAFLEIAAPTRSLPILTLQPSTLDFGTLRCGEQKTIPLNISNSGRGYLHGTLQAQHAWILVNPSYFGCLSSTAQKIDIQVNTDDLSGTELGVDYNSAVVVLSNRGQQNVPIQFRLVDEPIPMIKPERIELGTISWGTKTSRKVMVTNQGGGILQGNLVADEPWLIVDKATRSFTLGRGHSQEIEIWVDAAFFQLKGDYTGNLQAQTRGFGNPSLAISVSVDVPYLLDPAQPNTSVSRLNDLVNLCDRYWEVAVGWLKSARIEAFLRFIYEDALAQIANRVSQYPDPNAGLEELLRAMGAAAPSRYVSNINEVLSQLGFGLLPKLGVKPPIVVLKIENADQRGYLHGIIQPLAPWISIPQPLFGCLPGKIAQVEIHADHSARKGGALSLGKELFEIVFE